MVKVELSFVESFSPSVHCSRLAPMVARCAATACSPSPCACPYWPLLARPCVVLALIPSRVESCSSRPRRRLCAERATRVPAMPCRLLFLLLLLARYARAGTARPCRCSPPPPSVAPWPPWPRAELAATVAMVAAGRSAPRPHLRPFSAQAKHLNGFLSSR